MTNTPNAPRPPKKTVSIEVRVSEEEKRDFMAACRSANRSASAALRGLMGLFVVLQHSRNRMLEMLKSLITRPLRALAASTTTALAVSASLLLAPSASADMRLAYQVIVDDGVGQIVSMGETREGEATISDSLGDDVRFELVAVPCSDSEQAECDAAELRVTLSEYRDGDVFRELVHGVSVSDTDSTRYESELSDGRMLVVHVMPRA